MSLVPRQVAEGVLDVRIGDVGQHAPGGLLGGRHEALVGVAAVLLEPAFEEVIQMRPIIRCDPATLREQVGKRLRLAAGPGRASLDELVRADQVTLEGQHAEQQVAIGVHGRSLPLAEAAMNQLEVNIMAPEGYEILHLKIRNLTMIEKADAAFRKAMEEVIERARQTRTPVIVWEDGREVEYSADEMEKKIPPTEMGR